MAWNNPVNANETGFQSITSGGVWHGRTLTAGAGITISNGDGTAGNPTITATGAGFAWADKAISFTAVAENGYVSTAAGVVATLPTAGATNGTTIAFIAGTTDVFKIQPATSDKIRLGNTLSTNGTGSGYIQSTAVGDSCELVYQSSSGIWLALNFVGNWSIV